MSTDEMGSHEPVSCLRVSTGFSLKLLRYSPLRLRKTILTINNNFNEMNEDFNNNDIARYVQESIVENIKEDFKSETKKVPYIWLLRPLKKDIVNAIKSSIYRDDIDEEIYFWHGNNKYFVTDKHIIYSVSTYKTNYKEKIDTDTFQELYYADYKSIAELETARNNAKANGEPFVCRQLRRLKPENRQLDLKIKPDNAIALKEMGYTVHTRFNDATCRNDNYVRIGTNEFIDIVINHKETVEKGKAGRKGKEFAILAKGIVTVYKNKKECYEKAFADICGEKTFKRAIKDKDIGDTFIIKGLSCEIVDPSHAHWNITK